MSPVLLTLHTLSENITSDYAARIGVVRHQLLSFVIPTSQIICLYCFSNLLSSSPIVENQTNPLTSSPRSNAPCHSFVIFLVKKMICAG